MMCAFDFLLFSRLGVCTDYCFKVRSHCAICDCDLFLLMIGCIGGGDVVAVAQCEHLR